MERRQLGQVQAEPARAELIQQINAGESVCVTISDLLTANSSGNFFNFGHTSLGTAGVSMNIGVISMTIMAAKR